MIFHSCRTVSYTLACLLLLMTSFPFQSTVDSVLWGQQSLELRRFNLRLGGLLLNSPVPRFHIHYFSLKINNNELDYKPKKSN